MQDNNIQEKLEKIREGFKEVEVDSKFKEAALENIETWLTEEEFKEYVPQINYLIEVENWDLLLDCFYQLIPFGTAGRRGEVGIGPNRINVWTLQGAAQGHSQYLKKKFGDEAKSRGVVISYDVRVYLKESDYDNNRPNPVYELDCKTLAIKLAEVYAANDIKVFMFKTVASTPELSFMIRHKNAVASNMVSASHNPPEYNGQKVMDEHGGQLIPPHDEELITEVVDNVDEIKTIPFDEGLEEGRIEYLTEEDHEAYLEAASKISLNDKYRSVKILFSPYHGTSKLTTLPVLKKLGFDVTMDEESGEIDPKFSSIMFNIPNPEVKESFLNLIPEAEKIGADIIMTTDPDGDRFGLMSREEEEWKFYSGNEFFILSVVYMLEEMKEQGRLKPGLVLMKTVVTSGLLEIIGKEYDMEIIPDLLVGYKYVADQMNKLEEKDKIDDFLVAGEESHGMNAGDYIREKDSTVPSILIGELASKLKDRGETLGQYLNDIYMKFGYFKNYATEIRLPGAEGMGKMAGIMEDLRQNKPTHFGEFEVDEIIDRWEGEEFVSKSDKTSRNVIIFDFKNRETTKRIRTIIRPSGTEPKMKFYFEIGVKPTDDLDQDKETAQSILDDLEKSVLTYAYDIIGIDFPERGFLLFNQLPALTKMEYFEIEPKIVQLKELPKEERKAKLDQLLEFLGSDPIRKVDKAFKAKYQIGIEEFLEI